MSKTNYKEIEVDAPKFPPRALLEVSAGARSFTASLEPFGPGHYSNNVTEMQKVYSHPKTGELITFRPAKTSQSILAVARDFANRAKPKILDPRWLQAGRIVRAKEGVFTNAEETDEAVLKGMLSGAKDVNGIYVFNNNVAFAPYGYIPHKK